MAITSGTDPAGPVLILAPAGRDAKVIAQLLRSAAIPCAADDGERLFEAILSGAACAAVITDDAIARLDVARLREVIQRQPPWSDFPFVLLARRGEARQGSRTIEDLVNVTALERPLHPVNLISAVRAALRGRERQRLAAAYLAERDAAEAQLRELAETLEQKVAERTRDLAEANDRLTAEIAERERIEARLIQAQKMEAVGQLTGGIAHDFNNLLTAIIGSIDLLTRRTDDEEVLRLARNALQASERGAKLTAQLLAFSRRQRLSPAAVDPNKVVSGMADLLSRAIGTHISIEMRLDPGLWRALADPTQLEVMVLNLAINARDAMPGGGRLRIETRNLEEVPQSLAAELAPGEYVGLSVADNGCGMAPDVLARAFEPFFTTKAQGKGTGLGLAQLYGFARQSGGTARIESEEGQGTTVTIYLPRTHEHAAEAALAMPESPGQGSAKVLVVDDDEGVRTVAAAIVEELGFKVLSAATGKEALRILGEDERIDLLLTDIVMPEMTGVELARQVRAMRPALPILFASGYADVKTFGEELETETVLKKPFRIAEVAARVREVLEAKAGGEDDGNVIAFKRR
ncbi:MAG TPA: response regulator [Allosphingosinicella sp.]|jgi:signal transduction histidine kinase/ActR/RegA family two-component response regulator